MRKEFKAKLTGDETRKDASAAFTLPFDTRDVWGRAKVPVKVTINGYTWRSTVGNRGGRQYIARRDRAVMRGGGTRSRSAFTCTTTREFRKLS